MEIRWKWGRPKVTDIDYMVHSTIIFLGSLVLDFVENLRARKLNKAQKKQAKITGVQYKTCSSPIRAVRSHSLVCSKNSLLIVGIGPILNKELELIFRSDRSDRTCVYT